MLNLVFELLVVFIHISFLISQGLLEGAGYVLADCLDPHPERSVETDPRVGAPGLLGLSQLAVVVVEVAEDAFDERQLDTSH